MEIKQKKQLVIVLNEDEARDLVGVIRDDDWVANEPLATLAHQIDAALDSKVDAKRPFRAAEERHEKKAKRVSPKLDLSGDGDMVTCDVCGKEFKARAINVHKARKHGVAASAE